MIPERAVQAASGEKQPVVTPRCNVYEQKQWPVQQDIPKGVIVAVISC